jgi:hypothetical protein
MNILELELSSCHASSDYYVSKLKEASKAAATKDVEEIILEVDRGVDFDMLGHLLLGFPKLKILRLSQNYSYGVCIDLDDFILFLELLRLEKLFFDDLQSKFLENIDPDTLFNKLPGGCTYYITSGFEKSNGENHIHPSKDKYMVFVR